MGLTSRWGLRIPTGTDTPDAVRDIGNLANDLDNVAKDDQGTSVQRDTAATRKRGFWWWIPGTPNKLARSDGSNWHEIPNSRVWPHFHVYAEGEIANWFLSTQGIIGPFNLVGANDGAGWNGSAQQWVCPVGAAGWYQFNAGFDYFGSASNFPSDIYIQLRSNGFNLHPRQKMSTQFQVFRLSAVAFVNEGQAVDLYSSGSGTPWQGTMMGPFFNGYRLA